MKRQKQPQQGVFAEAWQNMSADMEKILPKTLHGRKNKFKFGFGLLLVELIILGVGGKLIYDWLTG